MQILILPRFGAGTEMGDAFAVRNLVKSYGSQQILKSVSFSIAEKDFAVILGPSGCGKTTLLNILGGLDRPTSGEVTVAGMEIAGADEDELARLRLEKIGFVFQDHNLLLDLTVRENVALPMMLLGEIDQRQVDSLLDRFEIDHIANVTTNRISGGEAQRVAIARALANSPEMILADEPTGNLDETNSEIVVDAMWSAREKEGVTVVVVTHDKSTVRRACTTMRLAAGQIENMG